MPNSLFKAEEMRKKSSQKKTIATGLVIILLIFGIIKAYQLFQDIYGSNVKIEKEYHHIHIPSGSELHDVVEILSADNVLKDSSSFLWLAEKKNYQNHINPGRYKIRNNMNNNDLINLLRSGAQTPVKLVINNIVTKEDLAGKISSQIEADSTRLMELLQNDDSLQPYGFTSSTVHAMIIPNTYEFWWNTSAEEFMKRMNTEYEKFWDSTRQEKADKMNLTRTEVTTLASIVDEETIRDDEMPKIAGVYVNRLQRGMRLQADPTIKFAMGDVTIQRVLKKYLEKESPYNTYKNYGLPPGPISFPSIKAIESVLNYEKHDYLYFSAKPDFSGYHNFSKTHRQHINNARKYQRALNEKRILN